MIKIIFQEKLDIKTAKKFTKMYDKSYLEDIFLKQSSNNSKTRIYIPLKKKVVPPQTVVKYLKDNTNYKEFQPEELNSGYLSRNDGSRIKVNKILSNNKAPQPLIDEFALFINKLSKDSNENDIVVISRHPYDIAGMSTDREWDSCMNLEYGVYKNYVPIDIKSGSIISYLISPDDKNIEHPKARILIKPYENVEDSSDLMYAIGKVYSNGKEGGKAFEDTVQDWINKNLNKGKKGGFKKRNGYNDKDVSAIIKGDLTLEKLLKLYNIKNYTINSDGTVDVDGDVHLSYQKLTKIPIKFGKVSGNFYCSENNLTSLENCPKEVGRNFYCFGNKLTSLEGCPKIVNGDFDCSNNNLTSLKGCPNTISGNFYCFGNKLTSLEGCPKIVNGDFECYHNKKQFTEEEVRAVCDVKERIIVS